MTMFTIATLSCAVCCAGAAPMLERGDVVVRVTIVNDAGIEADVVTGARDEAGAIWGDAGLRLEWLDRTTPRAEGGRVVTIRVRGTDLSDARVSSPAPRGGRRLGWTLFSGATPIDTIEVSAPAVLALVLPAGFADRRVADLPIGLRQHLIGRALGRVIAHEIGHWLGVRTHTATGLMTTGISGEALVERNRPVAPRDCLADARRAGGVAAATP